MQTGSATGEHAPKRQSRSKKPSANEVYQATAAAIFAGDQVACWVVPTWQQERLNDAEIGKLARAFGDEILDSEKLTKWLMQAQKSGVHVKLAIAIASVALPRMVNHGMLPGGIPSAPADVESGGTHEHYRDDGVGQIPVDEPPAGYPPPFYRSQEQSGFGEVPGEPVGVNGGGHERSPLFTLGTEAEV
jgi:hypothetical protein